jgi:S1-C subfamily serine protease
VRNFFFAFVLAISAPLLLAQQVMNNDSVIKLCKAGLSDDLIVSTINASTGKYDSSADGLVALTSAGVSDKVIAAIVQRASVPQVQSPSHGGMVDNLTAAYKQYRNSVVTVLAEYGPAKGTGFIVDKAGLVITNQHVVSKSEWVAVQVDEKTRLSAKILAADPEKDIAILWVNLLKAGPVEPVVLLKTGDTPAEEGERVFTIGSPLHQSKILTTGIVSKVEDRAIISDININHGNSGGPLFNSKGEVIGVTTFGDFSRQGGPGIAGIVRIEQALPLLASARAQMSANNTPSDQSLPLEPSDRFPIDAIKEAASVKKFKMDPYVFGVGDYDLAVVTPILQYRKFSSRVEAANAKNKRNQKSESAAKGTFEPLDDLRGWEEYVGEYQPILMIQASPKLVEGFWSAFGRGMAASHGYAPGPAHLHFKTDFYKMQLFCGDKEVQPIMPGKAERVLSLNNEAVRVTDATFDGLYEYPYDAIRPECGKVTLKIFSEKNPNEPKVKELETKTIDAVVRDFAPYQAQESARPASKGQ